MKILIVKLSAFGDIIHTLPALDDLMQRPEVDEIHWLVDSRYAFVTEIFPQQVHVTSVSLKGKQPLKSAFRAIQKLRREKFDLMIDLQGLIKSGVIARAIGSPVFGFDRKHLPEHPNGLFTKPVTFHKKETHVVQWYRRIAAGAFLEYPDHVPNKPLDYQTPHLELPETIHSHTTSLLTKLALEPDRYIVLNMGGGYPTKRLPDATWLETANQILGMGLSPVLIWGNEAEQTRATQIAKHNSAIKVLPERLETLPLCAFLKTSRALISADTGLLHLAAALNVPTVSFWGPTQPDTLGPLGKHDLHIIAPVTCIGCRKRTCNDFICMPKITPEMLLTQIKNTPD